MSALSDGRGEQRRSGEPTGPATRNVRGTNSRGASLDLVGLSKSFGRVVALEDVSLQIEPGEFVSLLGPSGAGKTTALRLIAGFEHPDAGEILVDGVSVTLEPAHRRNIGVVFQNYALFPHLTVFQNVKFPLRMRNVAQPDAVRRVGEVLRLVQLEGLDDRLPSQLSGGQQQRVALARALVFEPDILLMDEPLAALDKKLRDELRVEVKRLQAEVGATVVYVTHDQDEALALSDRVAILYDGRIEQIGSPREIYEEPSSHFVADFVGEGNFFPCRVTRTDPPYIEVVSHQTGQRLLTATDEASWQTGDEAVYMVRSEHVRIRVYSEVNMADLEANAFPATVVESFYLGDRITHILDIGQGVRVTASLPADSLPTLLVRQDECIAHWSAQAALLLYPGASSVTRHPPGT